MNLKLDKDATIWKAEKMKSAKLKQASKLLLGHFEFIFIKRFKDFWCWIWFYNNIFCFPAVKSRITIFWLETFPELYLPSLVVPILSPTQPWWISQDVSELRPVFSTYHPIPTLLISCSLLLLDDKCKTGHCRVIDAQPWQKSIYSAYQLSRPLLAFIASILWQMLSR